MIGTTEIAIPKYIAPKLDATGDPCNCLIMMGKVYSLGERMMTNGKRKLFHEPMKVKIPIVAIAGLNIGKTKRWNMYVSPAPSIRPDSRMDIGIVVIRNCLKKNTVNGAAIAGMISGQ